MFGYLLPISWKPRSANISTPPVIFGELPETDFQDLSIMTTWSLLLVMLVVGTITMSPLAVDARSPALHRVGGGRYTWKTGVNFTDWSSHQRFFVGDWLYFGFDRRNYSVLEVNRTGYEHCVEKGFIANVTRGGRDVFNLTESRPYFFVSGHGFCSQGVKVGINVLAGDDSAASSASSVNPSRIFLLALLYLLSRIYSIVVNHSHLVNPEPMTLFSRLIPDLI